MLWFFYPVQEPIHRQKSTESDDVITFWAGFLDLKIGFREPCFGTQLTNRDSE